MIGTEAAKNLLGAAVVVLKTARDATGHVAWWLRYQVEGTAREDEDPPPATKRSEA